MIPCVAYSRQSNQLRETRYPTELISCSGDTRWIFEEAKRIYTRLSSVFDNFKRRSSSASVKKHPCLPIPRKEEAARVRRVRIRDFQLRKIIIQQQRERVVYAFVKPSSTCQAEARVQVCSDARKSPSPQAKQQRRRRRSGRQASELAIPIPKPFRFSPKPFKIITT